MTITIPVWVFWILGGAAGLIILLLAAIGIAALGFFWDFKIRF